MAIPQILKDKTQALAVLGINIKQCLEHEKVKTEFEKKLDKKTPHEHMIALSMYRNELAELFKNTQEPLDASNRQWVEANIKSADNRQYEYICAVHNKKLDAPEHIQRSINANTALNIIFEIISASAAIAGIGILAITMTALILFTPMVLSASSLAIAAGCAGVAAIGLFGMHQSAQNLAPEARKQALETALINDIETSSAASISA